MTTRALAFTAFLFLGTWGYGCAKPVRATLPAPGAPETSTLSMIFAGADGLDGAPNIFEVLVTSAPGADAIRRSGDLPAAGQVIAVDNLPVAAAATVEARLYRDSFDLASRTHTCAADAPLKLAAGETSSLALTCIPLANGDGLKPVKVFVKVAKASLELKNTDVATLLAARDWSLKSLFAFNDEKGRRISLKQDAAALTINIGGELSYSLANGAAQILPIQRLLSGDTLTLTAIHGRLLDIAPDDATLKLSGKALMFEEDNGDLKGLLPIALANASGTITADGRLLEEPADTELTVVSYNVENFFDQTDEDRNASYGDFRINANPQGQFSNWGQLVAYEGEMLTFTQVKARNIRKALQGIDPTGPEVVGLVEIESQGSLDLLLEEVKDLGYVTAQFSTWAPDMEKTAIGEGILSKYPLKKWGIVRVPAPLAAEGATTKPEASRPILKATLDVKGHDLTVYVNHWKSKGGPESHRKLYAQALEDDITALLAADAKADYLILGDLNSDYNETVIIEPVHNDTKRMTGINDVIHAQGDELAVLKGKAGLKYNLHYELDRVARRSAWYPATGWASLDHMILGAGLYDRTGVTYVDNSFQIATPLMPRLSFLFNANGTPNRWHATRVNSKETRHEVGGYSDHLPIFARYVVSTRQSPATIPLLSPGKPDASDM